MIVPRISSRKTQGLLHTMQQPVNLYGVLQKDYSCNTPAFHVTHAKGDTSCMGKRSGFSVLFFL